MSVPADPMVDENLAAASLLSPSFFYQYDALGEDAASLKSAEASMNQAKTTLQRVSKDFDRIKDQVKRNRACHDEQVDRIKTVSTHWFYGTTALQPQLWFRGGCQGKIERAKEKLEKADSDYPNLLKVQEQLEKHQLPPLVEALRERKEKYERAVAAASAQEEMKEDAVVQHPSPRLFQLQEQTLSLQKQLKSIKIQAERVAQARTYQKAALRCCSFARSSLDEADTLHRRYISQTKELQEARVSSLSRNTSAMATRPCATAGCGYALSSWHPTHCCNACKQQKPPPHDHGKHCERKSFDTGEAQRQHAEQQARERLQRDVQDGNTRCQKRLTEAQEYADQAVNQLRQASTVLQIILSNDGSTVAANMSILSSSPPTIISPISFACSNTRDETIRQALRVLGQHKSDAEWYGKTICKLEQRVQEERNAIEQRQEQTKQDVLVEKSRIFDELRSQVVFTSIDDNVIPEPSAPPGPW